MLIVLFNINCSIKNLQTADMVSDYWQMKKVILMMGLNENCGGVKYGPVT